MPAELAELRQWKRRGVGRWKLVVLAMALIPVAAFGLLWLVVRKR
jgi:hypothetical protein